jgi:MFS family permease
MHDPSISNGRDGKSMEADAEYRLFRRRYLAAFLCGAAADWIKGPYIYKFYKARGFAPEDITVLFVSGYVSSAIFGAIAGMFCDAFGRRRTCLAFCLLYGVHAVMHAAANFWVLLLARVVSGVATALLSCTFDAWMVAEHRRRFPGKDLSKVFSVQTQGNALTAMGAGVVAQGAVSVTGDFGAPFGLAVLLLMFCSSIVWGWTENVGAQTSSVTAVFWSATASMNSLVVRVGLLQCLFEGSMHVFVFLWTPCLEREGSVPHGLLFSLFMASMMLGGRLAQHDATRPPLGVVFSLAARALTVPALMRHFLCILGAFCTFEACCGCYFPQIAMLRSKYLAEESRAATITLFRIPLNAIVVSVLLWGRSRPPEFLLLWAAAALGLGALIWSSLPSDATAGEDRPHQERKKAR